MSNHENCVYNCGGTGCDGLPYMWTGTKHEKCLHENGVFIDVKFWIFTKRIFVCTDCGEHIKNLILEGKGR